MENNTIISRLLSPSSEQAKDTGLALILISLLISHIGNLSQFVLIAIILLLITMIFPDIFKPAAWVWFGLSHLLGTIASKVILSIIFFILVTPVGFIRRMTGSDTLQLREWKKSKASVFRNREHKFSATDIEKPF